MDYPSRELLFTQPMRTYLKKDHKYWSMKKINKYSMKFWYFIASIMTLTVIYAALQASQKATDLISPLVLNPVTPVYASETISCENPKGYLECQVYNGRITWAQHDRISKVINCESKWNPEAIHVNKNGTVDRGLVQSNSIHIKTLSNADAFDYKKSIDWMINKMHKDGGLNAWVCNRLVK